MHKLKRYKIWISILAVIVLAVGTYAYFELKEPDKLDIVTLSNLEKIVDVSELSTFETFYNGIAVAMNEKKTSKVDYYVSYSAKVKAGFDSKGVRISFNESTNKFTVIIPEIKITEIIVDPGKMEGFFENDKANESGVTASALKLCEDDVANEIASKPEVIGFARENAKNFMFALLNPYIQQLDPKYELVILVGGGL